MPTNFGTGFGPSIGSTGWNNPAFSNNQVFSGNKQVTAPTKQQKFPGLNDEQIKRLESITSDPQMQQTLYQQTIKQLNSKNIKESRIAAENEMSYRNLNQKDVRQKNYTDSQIRLEQLADLTKEKYGLRQDAPTQEVAKGLIAMAQDKGVSLDEMNNYLDSGDQNFLYNMGLKENPREKLKDNFMDALWDNIRTKVSVPIDSAKKRGQRTVNELGADIYKKVLKNVVGDTLPESMGINVDNYMDEVINPAVQENILNYQEGVNERYRAREQRNMDQDIKNYYENKGYTKLLGEGDFKGFLYKSMGDAAQNWEMPAVIAASVFQPEIGMALMTTDAYTRENQEAFENMMNNGATYEQAEQGAVVVGLVNAAVEVTLEKLIGGVETRASNAIRNTLMKNVQEEAAKKGLGKILLEGAGTQLKASGEEGLEEIVQQIVQNAAAKTVNENQELFEGVGQAFEGGFYNPLNLLAGGGNINQNIQANKNEIRQSIMDTAATATTQSRDLLDAISDKAQDMGDTAKNKVSGLVDQTYGIDETLKKGIQNNPYAAQVWAKTKEYIEENGRPEKSNEVSKSLISDVADRVQEKLMEKMKEGGESGSLYKPLLDAGYSVDLSELKDGIDDLLEKYGIKIEEYEGKDGETKTVLNFDKTAIDGSEANNIRKIYNWIKDTNKPMSLDEYKNRFRQSMSDMVDFNQVGRDHAGRKTADTQGDKVLKGIRSFANDLAHNQIPELAAVDKKFNEWVKVMDEVSDGLVYRDSSKRGVIRDNIAQIISNLDTKNRRQLANRLEKLMPGITEEVHAINMMPQLIDHVYKPTKLQKGITSGAGGVVGAAVGSLVGQPVIGSAVGAGIGYWLSGKIDQLKSKKWDKIISETSEDGKAKLNDIQARIKKNEKISQEQKAFLEKMSKKLKEGKADKEAEVAKIIAEVSSAEGDVVSVLNNAIDRLETIGAKQEVKELKGWMNEIQKSMDEKAETEQLLGGIRDQRVGGLDKSQASSETARYQVADDYVPTKDSAGKSLSKGQQEYFKGSKVVDKDGNLLRVYHGTHGDFTIFDRKKIGSKTNNKGIFGEGFYFTSNKKYGDYYAQPQRSKEYQALEGKTKEDIEKMRGKTMEGYLNITNPFYWRSIKTPKAVQRLIETLGLGKNDLERNSTMNNQMRPITEAKKAIKFRNALEKAGYDGIIYEYDGADKDGNKQDEIVAFDSNQFKNIDNLDPTENPDIRYQKYGTANPNERGISAAEGLNIRNFKNGKSVQELANQYGIDTKIVDSISTPEGQRAYGMYGDRLITLSKDLKESTVPHELLHGVFDMVDSKRRTSILEGIQRKLDVDNVQAEEWLADSFSEYYRTGKFGTQGLAKTFVEKVKQFFYEIKKYIDGTYANEKQIRQLFDDIIDGKIEGEYGVYSDPKFQSVWHGSPYEFERFDSSNMGKGEGAQAHGWGHYVAVDKDTGLGYAKMGARKYQGKQIGGFGDLYSELDASKEYSVDVANAVKEISLLADKEDISIKEAKQRVLEKRKGRLRDAEERLEKAKKRGIERNIEDVESMVNRTKTLIDIMNKIDENDFSNRNLYEVEIPDPVKADTPTGSNYWEESKNVTSKQFEKIAEKLKEQYPYQYNNPNGWYDQYLFGQFLNFRQGGFSEKMTGREIYNMISEIVGSDKEASKFLESLGYDGIHYFGNRDGEAYVIFNDDALEITKHHKY